MALKKYMFYASLARTHCDLLCQEVFCAASSVKRLRQYSVPSEASSPRRLLGSLLTKESAI